MELDDKYKLIGKDARVVDLGAAPGGWSQVALQRGAAKVIGIDLLPIVPVAGAEFIQGDFMAEGMDVTLTEMLGGKADLVLSDMAPNTTGHVATDHIRIMALAETALAFACEILNPGGAFVAKLFQGGAERDMLNTLKLQFRNVRHAKPPASRKDSKEMYVVATGFRGGEQA
jgi:23S rRNA (uridine2552-2'-O)-methyltransferase